MKENDAPRPVGELEPPPFAPHPHQSPEDMTILARWLARAMDQGPLFWVLLGGAAVVLGGVGVLVSSLSAADSVAKQAWFDSIRATTPEDQIKIADAHPKTPVGDWVRLQAGYEEFRAGSTDLTAPGRRESAGPRLKRALDLFRQVATDAPHASPQGREAAFAVARVYETRNELPEAIKQYRLVAEQWPDTPEARESTRLARALEDPTSIQFYKDLYTARPALGTPTIPDLPLTGGLGDLAPPPPTPSPATIEVPAGGKPVDLVAPGTSGAGKSFLPDLPSLDPPPATTTPAPTPVPETKPAPAPTPAPETKPAPAPPTEKPK